MSKHLRIHTSIAAILMAAASAMAFPASHYSINSRLAQGRWVKVRVQRQGIQQISYEQLRQWGFSDPAAVNVYGTGGAYPSVDAFSASYADDLTQTATVHTADGRILFYGEKDLRTELKNAAAVEFQRNYYDTEGYYFLSDCEQTETVPVMPIRQPAKETAPTIVHYHVEIQEDEVQNPMQSGVFFHGPKMSIGESRRFDFHIEDYASLTSSGSPTVNGSFQYDFAARGSNQTPIALSMTPSENISVVGTLHNNECTQQRVASRAYNVASGWFRFNASEEKPLDDAQVSVTVTVPPTASTVVYAAIDRVTMIYPRLNRLGKRPAIDMHIASTAVLNQPFELSDVPADVVMWDVTDPSAIHSYELAYDSEKRKASGSFERMMSQQNGTGHFVVFDPSATHNDVIFAGDVANQNIHGMDTPDMLIITTPTLKPYAEELAEIHRRRQGIYVTVLTQDEIFNEFSSGTRSVMGYRRAAKMFYDRDPSVFRYILLYGSATWDNRFIATQPRDVLLSYQVQNQSHAVENATCYTSDNYFAMLGDNYRSDNIYFQPTHASVGRLPVVDASKARKINNKIARFFENPPSPATYLRGIFISDDGDQWVHTRQSQATLEALREHQPGFTAMQGHTYIYPRKESRCPEMVDYIAATLKRGAGYFTYSGHGTEQALGLECFWTDKLAESTLYSVSPLAMLATCVSYPLDRMNNAMADAMVFKEDGGMIGVIAASRSVYLEFNQTLNRAVAVAYSKAEPGMCYGDLLRIARNEMLAEGIESNSAINTMAYNYCGDPALPIPAPRYGIKVESINGTAIAAAGDAIAVTPLAPLRIKARITDSEGRTVERFNGTGLVEVYDGPHIELGRRHDSGDRDSIGEFTIDERLLAEKPVTVRDGFIDAELVLPEPAYTGLANNRIVITATDTSRGDHAAGFDRHAAVTAAGDNAGKDLDRTAPQILQFYIDNPAFAPGDIVGGDFTVHAIIDPSPTGLNLTNTGIGQSSILTLDDDTSFKAVGADVSYKPDGTAHMSTRINAIGDGRHTLRLSVANNAGVRAYATLDFTAIASAAQASLTTDSPVARGGNVTLDLSHSFPETPDARLIVTDSQGNTVFSREHCSFPFEWDLKDLSGEELPDGRYEACAVMRCGLYFGSTPRTEIIVIR